MINEKKYYKILYKKLIDQNYEIFANCDEKKKKFANITISGECFDWLYGLLDQVEKKYEFDMQKMLPLNYRKFLLWQQHYLGKIDIQRIEIAVEFIIFCCLADKILDSGRFTDDNKGHICEKIVSKNFCLEDTYESKNFIELDMLLNHIRRYIAADELNAQYILNIIDRAFVSEIYMYRNPLGKNDSMLKNDYHFLIDKSVEFERAAFMLSTYGINTAESEAASINVGEIFWIIDDLCDFAEDIKYKRRNSILFLGIDYEGPIDLPKRIDYALKNLDMYIDRLKKNLSELRSSAGVDFYDYIINELWEWCTDVRSLCQ